MKEPKPRPPRPHSSRDSSLARRQREARKPMTVTRAKRRTKTTTSGRVDRLHRCTCARATLLARSITRYEAPVAAASSTIHRKVHQ